MASATNMKRSRRTASIQMDELPNESGEQAQVQTSEGVMQCLDRLSPSELNRLNFEVQRKAFLSTLNRTDELVTAICGGDVARLNAMLDDPMLLNIDLSQMLVLASFHAKAAVTKCLVVHPRVDIYMDSAYENICANEDIELLQIFLDSEKMKPHMVNCLFKIAIKSHVPMEMLQRMTSHARFLESRVVMDEHFQSIMEIINQSRISPSTLEHYWAMLEYLVRTQMRCSFNVWENVFLEACRHGRLDLATHLVEIRGVKPNYGASQGIVLAAARGHAPVVKYLLTHASVDPSVQNNAAIDAATDGHYIACVKLLIRDRRVYSLLFNSDDMDMRILAQVALMQNELDG